MIFRQLIHDDLGCASYFIGDESAGVAAVVDPSFSIESYLELARYIGVRIEHIFETHNHADHLSGHGRLSDATGAVIRIHSLAQPCYDHEPFDDGDEFLVGSVIVTALHTPGHRPEHTAFVLADERRSREPWAVLTGDSLFVGDIARPDLAIEAAHGAREVYRSLHRRLLPQEGNVEIWPGHLGGSMCGGPGIDMKISSTIGYERLHNPVLEIRDEDEFVERIVADLGPKPPNFQRIVELNTGPLITRRPELPALDVGEIEKKMRAGALAVDLRAADQFDAGHVPGAVSNPMTRAGFGTKLAWIAGPDQEVVFIAGDDADAVAHAGLLAVSVGVLGLGGYLSGGVERWLKASRPLRRIDRLPAQQLPDLLAARPEFQVLDVRGPEEWAIGVLPDSLLVPWHDVTRYPSSIDSKRPVAVICASGERAGTAASLVARAGDIEVLHVVEGGVPLLGRFGYELVRGAGRLRVADSA